MCVDLEASGLGAESWPIEIGVAWIDDAGKIRSDSQLIRPDPSWSPEGWSDESAAIHGIARDALEAAPTTDAVAHWFLEMSRGRPLLSDAPEFDAVWLARVVDLDANGLRLLDYDRAAWTAFSGVPGALHKVFAHRAKQRTTRLSTKQSSIDTPTRMLDRGVLQLAEVHSAERPRSAVRTFLSFAAGAQSQLRLRRRPVRWADTRRSLRSVVRCAQ